MTLVFLCDYIVRYSSAPAVDSVVADAGGVRDRPCGRSLLHLINELFVCKKAANRILQLLIQKPPNQIVPEGHRPWYYMV